MLAVDPRHVDPQTVIEPVGLGTDLIGSLGFRSKWLHLRGDERPWIRAAALETRRYAGVGHEFLGPAIVKVYAIVGLGPGELALEAEDTRRVGNRVSAANGLW